MKSIKNLDVNLRPTKIKLKSYSGSDLIKAICETALVCTVGNVKDNETFK